MKKLLIALIGLLLLPINAFALTGKVSISCGKTILAPKETTTCNIAGSSDGLVSGLSLAVSSSGNVSFSNLVATGTWQGNASDGTIDLYTDENKAGSFSIATFTVTAGSEGTGSISLTGDYSDDAFEMFDVRGTISLTVKKVVEAPSQTPGETPGTNNKPSSGNTNNQTTTKSSDASLALLEIDDYDIEFASNILEYFLEVDANVDEVAINAEAASEKAEVVMPENLKLKTGENVLEIKVVAENGNERIYTIKITKLERVLSENNYLSQLNIKGYPINFKKEQYSYGVLDINEDYLDITYETEDSKAKVNIYGNHNISKNDNVIIEVIAENGDIVNYVIKVNNVSSNINWLLIAVGGLLVASLSFNIYFIAKRRKK